MRKATLAVGMLIAAGIASLAAQSAARVPDSCALLTAADVGAAVGGSAGQPQEMNMAMSKEANGPRMRGCMWGPTPGLGMVTYSVFPVAQGALREEGLAKLGQVTESLKAKGWKEDKKIIDHVICSMLTPPPSEKDAPTTTGCMAEAKGRGVSVSYLGKKSLPIENVKALLDKLVTRLP